MYDGANRALKVSRASVTLFAPARALEATGPDDLCAGESKKLNDAVIGRTMEGILDVVRGSPRDVNQPSRQQSATGSGIHRGERSYPHLVNPLHAVAHLASSLLLKRLAPHKAAIVARRNQRAPGLSSTEIYN